VALTGQPTKAYLIALSKRLAVTVSRRGVLEKGKVVYISGRLYRYLIPLMKTDIGGWLIARMGIERDH